MNTQTTDPAEWVDVRELVAAVRGVLALAEEIEAGHASTHTVLHDCPDRIRAVVAAAHTEAGR
jgi:hypothetical protein